MVKIKFFKKFEKNTCQIGDTVVISFLHPGVAQFGSALEWGSRGRRFDSSHSDQMNGKIPGIVRFQGFFYVSALGRKYHIRFAFWFGPWYNRKIKGRCIDYFVQPKEEAQQ